MKTFISIIKYFPFNNREDGYSIGMIIISNIHKKPIVKYSEERIKRINNAFGIKRSDLIDYKLNGLNKKEINLNGLDYLSKYENGNIRFAKPQAFFIKDFDENSILGIYNNLIADEKELKENDHKISQYRKKIRDTLVTDNILNSRLNIGYSFKDSIVNNFLFSNHEVDFIGGNGAVFCGEILNLDNEPITIQNNLYKILAVFEALRNVFGKKNKFKPEQCKIIISKDQAEKESNEEYFGKLRTWEKQAGYDLMIIQEQTQFVNKLRNMVEKDKIIPFVEWVKNISDYNIKANKN